MTRLEDLPEGKSIVDYDRAARLRRRSSRALSRSSSRSRSRSRWRSSPPHRAAPDRRTASYIVDLLAAIPSVVYGLWGIFVLGPACVPIMKWLEDNLRFIPLFKGPASVTGRAMFVAALVLAVMILPIVSAVAREVFAQTPRGWRRPPWPSAPRAGR